MEVFEERHSIHRDLNVQDQAEPVVHLEGHQAHLVFEASTGQADVEAISQFFLVVSVQLSSKESGNVCRFDGVTRGF